MPADHETSRYAVIDLIVPASPTSNSAVAATPQFFRSEKLLPVAYERSMSLLMKRPSNGSRSLLGLPSTLTEPKPGRISSGRYCVPRCAHNPVAPRAAICAGVEAIQKLYKPAKVKPVCPVGSNAVPGRFVMPAKFPGAVSRVVIRVLGNPLLFESR